MRGFARTVLPAAWLALTAAFAPRTSLAQETVDLPAVRDNTLFQSVAGDLSDGAGPVFFVGTSGLVPRRGLLCFDVAGALPAGSVITDVTLILQLSAAPNPTAAIIGIYPALTDWGEGTSSTSSSAGAPAAAGDATWLNTFTPAPRGPTPAATSPRRPVRRTRSPVSGSTPGRAGRWSPTSSAGSTIRCATMAG